jgi:hypothetical protein
MLTGTTPLSSVISFFETFRDFSVDFVREFTIYRKPRLDNLLSERLR